MFFHLISIAAFIVAASAIPLYNETKVDASCTITSYSDVSTVVKNCTNIIIQDLDVPAGKSLELNLKLGTTLTFKGTTSFGTGIEWEGPLIKIKGKKITVDGSGATLDGQGEKYWDGKGDKGTKKPKFFKLQATDGSIVSNINLLNCPHQCVSIQHSSQLTLDKWNIDVSAGDKNQLGHNTDGFDLSVSDYVTIKNSVIKNQDDCVAINSGSNYYFSNLQCSGGHGLSLSIGMSTTNSSKNEATNITFTDCNVSNSRNGIHIKTHVHAATGIISDVLYKNIKLSGITNYGINVQQDYAGGGSSGKPGTNIPIKGLTLNSVTGTLQGSESEAVYILCGTGACSDFNWSGISLSGASKSNSCNVTPSGFKC